MFDEEEKERNGRSDFGVGNRGRNYGRQNLGDECCLSGQSDGDQRERRRYVGLEEGEFVKIFEEKVQ